MDRFINYLDKKIGKYAIPRLPLIMLITYAVGYAMEFINSDIINLLSLNPYAILHGQVWRLVSWVLIPPEQSNLFFVLIMLYFYYSLGTTLENTWGTFYFNYYIFSGLIFTIVGAFCMYGYSEIFNKDTIAAVNEVYSYTYGECSWIAGGNYYYWINSMFFSTYYVNMSIFLAFAATYPEMRVYIMFILPVKVKVLGIIYAVILVVEALQMGVMGIFVIAASLLNFILFFISTRKGMRPSFKQRKRQKEFKRKVDTGHAHIAKHKCAICGRTSESNPELEFRFCSKCEGNYEFCQDHLFSHQHFTWNGGNK